jgi:DNA-binding response OmpR family regulator
MSNAEPRIVFLDNLIHRVYKTVESLNQSYKNLQIYSTEAELLEGLEHSLPDVIFLHLDLEPNDAVVLAREIRKKHPLTPPYIIIYSDKQDDFVQELAFNSGVDAFISFIDKLSVLRVFLQNLLRRRPILTEPSNRKIILDADKYLIYNYGTALQLPRKEFRLFELLYNNSDHFFSKLEIAEAIWNDPIISKKRTIDVHIYNIRQLFGKRIIQSQKGKGYRINKKVLG